MNSVAFGRDSWSRRNLKFSLIYIWQQLKCGLSGQASCVPMYCTLELKTSNGGLLTMQVV